MLSNAALCTLVLLFDVLVAGAMILRCSGGGGNSAKERTVRILAEILEVVSLGIRKGKVWMCKAAAAMVRIFVQADRPARVMVFSK